MTGVTIAGTLARAGAATWPSVTLRQAVHSTVPGQAGAWLMEYRMRLSRVPVAGDYVTWNDDWASERVKDVFLASGGCRVVLYPCSTDNPAILADYERMRMMGWKRVGGPTDDKENS